MSWSPIVVTETIEINETIINSIAVHVSNKLYNSGYDTVAYHSGGIPNAMNCAKIFVNFGTFSVINTISIIKNDIHLCSMLEVARSPEPPLALELYEEFFDLASPEFFEDIESSILENITCVK